MFNLFILFVGLVIAEENIRNIAHNRAVLHSSSVDSDHTGHLTTNGFWKTDDNNYWESKCNGEESLRIDLGVVSTFSQMKIYFKNQHADRYSIEISNDTVEWEVVYKTEEGCNEENVAMFGEVVASHVRLVLHHSATGKNYRVSNLEVIGHNKIPRKTKKMSRLRNADDERQYLSGTDTWRLIRALDTNNATGESISSASYNVGDWVEATVPGTVLVSYINNGAVADPNYGDQFTQISDSFYLNNFWYHDVFTVDPKHNGSNVWLNFDGINWKADIFVNGKNVGHIDGAYTRGKFDITSLVSYSSNNYLAVLIYKNDNPGDIHQRTEASCGGNGGNLGRDNPTVHASVGWDWIPTIRGRNIGIYNNVYLTYTANLLLVDPWVETHVNGTTATLTLHADVRNVGAAAASATVVGTVTPGNLVFNGTVNVAANGTGTVTANLTLANPQLWWPNRYGDQFLYHIVITVANASGAEASDRSVFDFGVREITYNKQGVFKIYVNGKRIYCTGGNWGMPEAYLRATTYEDFDIRVRLHKEAGFTMIRNWVGMTLYEDFYKACDRYGILIHDDFWLANPSDGPVPTNNTMFRASAQDKIRLVRRYASLAFYCGRNEGTPPSPLEQNLHDDTAALDGSRYYVANSAGTSYNTQLTGGGPYAVQNPEYYFQNGNENFHTERGLPNIPAIESIKEFIPSNHLWPTDIIWAQHDFTTGSAQNGTQFKNHVQQYGTFNNLEQFVARSQLVTYEAYKALFEGPSIKKGNAMLLWMSMSCYPSFVWQTFDFYYDTNAGYFGSKVANQRVNGVYNCYNRTLHIVNNCGKDFSHLTYDFYVYNSAGEQTNHQTATLSLAEDQVVDSPVPYGLNATAAGVYFLQTRITNGDNGEILGENFYWVDSQNRTNNFTALQNIANATLGVTADALPTQSSPYGGKINFLNVTIENRGTVPALHIRLKLIKRRSGKRVLPTYYENNYISLMPRQSKTVLVEFDDKYLDGDAYDIYYEGFNVAETLVR